ncbi:hypothetical protein LN42_06720 [Marinitoga sp. 1137]|uniref:glycosyltransferase n=1 Tax=Marinitoga sp. 1137 TaxID=1545835 RepID=UPI000950A9D8|nr:glycosyltransferase [Marinitoga sp. 1137]APT76106.1 hypothetical protein LN42_06720 [Marinitoga sp. 1137]
MNRRKLFLFTNKFPYDKDEEFLETEIPILANYFDIIIVPRYPLGNIRPIPENVEIDNFFIDYLSNRKISILGLTRFHKFIKEFINSKKIISYKSLEYFGMEFLLKKWYKKYSIDSTVIFYSYWLASQAYGLTQLNKNSNYKHIVISRTHRWDLYEDANIYHYLPLRKEILKDIDKVFCISDDGKNYLTKKYPEYSDKFEVSRLGVLPQTNLNKGSKDDMFRIVTCSDLVPFKRVHLVVEALSILGKKVNKRILWSHIGKGPLKEEIEELANKLLSKTNIEYKFLGYLKNKDVLNFYANNPIDLFINVSESEGLPVSIMEALSFGIPVMATNVGGTRELVDENIGKLLPSDLTANILADHIEQFINLSEKDKLFKRENALKRWNEKVNALKNYEDFSKRILKLLNNKKYH